MKDWSTLRRLPVSMRQMLPTTLRAPRGGLDQYPRHSKTSTLSQGSAKSDPRSGSGLQSGLQCSPRKFKHGTRAPEYSNNGQKMDVILPETHQISLSSEQPY